MPPPSPVADAGSVELLMGNTVDFAAALPQFEDANPGDVIRLEDFAAAGISMDGLDDLPSLGTG